MKTSNCKEKIGTYGEFCEALHSAIFGNKCVFCTKPRYQKNTVCRKCYYSCPKSKPVYDEITVRIKIRKD